MKTSLLLTALVAVFTITAYGKPPFSTLSIPPPSAAPAKETRTFLAPAKENPEEISWIDNTIFFGKKQLIINLIEPDIITGFWSEPGAIQSFSLYLKIKANRKLDTGPILICYPNQGDGLKFRKPPYEDSVILGWQLSLSF